MEDSTKKTKEIFERIDKIDQESKQTIIDYLDQCIELWEEAKNKRTTLDGISWNEATIWAAKHIKKVLQKAGRMIEGFKGVEKEFEHWGENGDINIKNKKGGNDG